MRMISSALAIATIGAMLGGTALTANAQPAGPVSGQPATPGAMAPTARPMSGPMHGPMHGPMQRHGMGDPAEHLKSLRADIGITDAQAGAWDAYAKVVQDTATQMRASRQGMNRHALMEMSTPDRLAFLMKQRDQREQAHGVVKAAADALLPALTDTQKVRALIELPGLAGPGRMMMKHHAMRMHGHDAPVAR